MASSADKTFSLIAAQKRILSKQRLNEAQREADGRNMSLERWLSESGEIPPDQFERIIRTRRRHGRQCVDCAHVTYLLPGQKEDTLPCERCEGPLLGGVAGGSTGSRSTRTISGSQRVIDDEDIDQGEAKPKPPPPPPKRPTRRGRDAPRRYSSGVHEANRQPPPGPRGTGRRPPPRPGGGRPPGGAGGPGGPPRRPPRRRPTGAHAGGPPPSRPRPPAGPPPPQVETDEASGLELTDSAELAAYQPPEEPAQPAPPEPEPEPAPKIEAVDPDSLSDEERHQRARKLRQAGAGFGYEPMEPEPKRPPPLEDDPDATLPEGELDDAAFAPPAGPRRGRRLGDPVEQPKRRLGEPIYGPEGEEEADEGSVGPPDAEPAFDVPSGPFSSLIGELITFPIKNMRGLFMISMAALFPFCFEILWKWAVGIVKLYVIIGGGVALVLLTLYPFAWLVRVAERGCQGGKELPGWPDFSETIGLGWRKFLTDMACVAPAIVIFACMVYEGSVDYPTIGPQAQMLSDGEEPMKGKSAAGVVLLDMDNAEVPLTGKWTVAGLIGRDSGEQVDVAETLGNMPSVGMGVEIHHARQIWDLERVARACGDSARVLGVWSDPSHKKISIRFPFTDERWHKAIGHDDGSDDEYEDDEYEDEYEDDGDVGGGAPFDDLNRAMEQAEHGMTWQAGGPDRGTEEKFGPDSLRFLENPFQRLEIVTTQSLGWPGPFQGTKRLPCVVIVDPSGTIRRQYPTGVWDQQLYADLLDLQAGGNGYARPKELPVSTLIFVEAETSLLPPAVGYGLFVVALLIGCFYYPMALLQMVSFNDGAAAWRYPAGLRAIGVTLGDYIALAGVFVGVQVGGMILRSGADFFLRNKLGLPPFVSAILGDYANWWLIYYGLLITSYGVGRYYQINAARLGWFDRRG